MNCLLDTHIFIWYINGDNKLSSKCKEIIQDRKNLIYLSSVSIWEIIIKANLGKIDMPSPIFKYLSDKRELHKIESLSFEEADLSVLEKLPDNDKDPFDRLLVCQAIQNDLILLSDDENVLKYPIRKI